MRELRTLLAAGGFVFAAAAFALVLAFGRAESQPVKAFQIPATPVMDPQEAAEILKRMQEERLQKAMEEEVRKKRALSEKVRDEIRKKYGGKLPEKIVLQSDIVLPGPFGSNKKIRKKSDPVIVYPHKRRVEFRVFANKVTRAGGRVEFLLCNSQMPSQAYESVLITNAHPYDVFRALALLELKPIFGVRFKQTPEDLSGDMVNIYLIWKDKSGKTIKRHASELVWNLGASKPARRTPWVFIGSGFGIDPATKKEFFVAKESGNIISVVHWPAVILDTPYAEFGYDDYVVNPKKVPPAGTEMTLVIEPITQEKK